MLSYSPRFVGTDTVVEKENVLGDGNWTLAAYLLCDVGQNCFCI